MEISRNEKQNMKPERIYPRRLSIYFNASIKGTRQTHAKGERGMPPTLFIEIPKRLPLAMEYKRNLLDLSVFVRLVDFAELFLLFVNVSFISQFLISFFLPGKLITSNSCINDSLFTITCPYRHN